MIEQQGFLRLVKSSLGKTTFVKSKDGYRAQEKMVVSTGRFKNDPKYARVRENSADFGHAATDGKVLRKALNSLLVSPHTRLGYKLSSKPLYFSDIVPFELRNLMRLRCY